MSAWLRSLQPAASSRPVTPATAWSGDRRSHDNQHETLLTTRFRFPHVLQRSGTGNGKPSYAPHLAGRTRPTAGCYLPRLRPILCSLPPEAFSAPAHTTCAPARTAPVNDGASAPAVRPCH